MPYRVKTYWRADRKRYQLEAVEVRTKEKHYKTLPASVTREREAEREAARWHAELEDVGVKRIISWEVARERFAVERLGGAQYSDDYRSQWRALANNLEAILSDRLQTIYDLDASTVSLLFAGLRDRGLSTGSLHAYRTMLGIFVRWAGDIWPAYSPLAMPKIGRVHATQSLTISREAMERMIDTCAAVVGDRNALAWEWLIEGLYWSGLRRSEVLRLRWDDFTGRDFHVAHLNSSHHRPVYVIHGADDKGGKTREFPVAPEFVDLLRDAPRREEYIFAPRLSRRARVHEDTMTHILRQISQRAGVSCGEGQSGRPISATAQQFRRTFGRRWAPKVRPHVLQVMMRHENLATTQKYYLGENAQDAADQMWAAYQAGAEPVPITDQIANHDQ